MGFFDSLFGSPEPAKKRNSFITFDNSYFRRNDENRSICEDMFADRYHNHGVDLESHYGWENKLNYDSDGYSHKKGW